MLIYLKIVCLIGGITFIMSSTVLSAQESGREHILTDDVNRLGDRAVRDKIISDEEHTQMLCFVRDSLPEGTVQRRKDLQWNRLL